MSDPGPSIDTAALRHALDALLPGIVVECVAETGSTNSDLIERARASTPAAGEGGAVQVRRSVESGAFARRVRGAPTAAPAALYPFAPCLLVAEHQHAGRGRHGRHWQSARGRSLTFSLAVALDAADWAGLSLAVGVALADALDAAAGRLTRGGAGSPAAAGLRVGLKWPNDLWLVDAAGAGRKLGGVLIEALPRGAERIAVIGIGINVLPQAVDGAATGFACWQEVDPQATPASVLGAVAAPLAATLRRFETEGFGAFAERFAARDVLRGRAVHTSPPDAMEGVALGVTARGGLALRTAAGIRHVESGAVSVRLDDDDHAAVPTAPTAAPAAPDAASALTLAGTASPKATAVRPC